jgi:hypothetical protein
MVLNLGVLRPGAVNKLRSMMESSNRLGHFVDNLKVQLNFSTKYNIITILFIITE